MKRKREFVTSYQAFELGRTYNVYEYFDENGKLVVDKKDADDIKGYNMRGDRQTLEGIIKKTDYGIKVCFQKLAAPHSELDSTRYSNQLRHHIETFVKNYLKKVNKEIEEEEIIDEVEKKVRNIVSDVKKELPNVDVDVIIKEFLDKENISNDAVIATILNNILNESNNEQNEERQ